MRLSLTTGLFLLAATAESLSLGDNIQGPSAKKPPLPPKPEPISLKTLLLPPAVADDAPVGGCDAKANPRGTGCLGRTAYFQGGGFSPDGNHVFAEVNFVGAPTAPNPSSIYNGSQLILVKADGKTFPNGDTWKCLTCGVPHEEGMFDNPQAFLDGKRVLAGLRIVDCGKYDLTSNKCTPETTNVYPLRVNASPDGSGRGLDIRELRLNPDNVHLGFNAFAIINGKLNQHGYFSRLSFNPSPTNGLPLGPRYDLINVTRLSNLANPAPVEVEGDKIILTRNAITVGEFRGFSGDGKEAAWIGYPAESSNVDAFATDLSTGVNRRLTMHPEYIDPIDFSRHGNWMAIMDTRGTNRNMFLSGMRYVPPLTDLVTTPVTASVRNNGRRRFFRPILLDPYGDRGDYFGQRINDQGSGKAGSGDYNDPEWNGRADPRWSFDGTKIVYWEEQTISPACGGENPLPCYPSKQRDGIAQRIVVATLTSRKPRPPPKVEILSDIVPWGEPYVPGTAPAAGPELPAGNYTLKGQFSGFAKVELLHDPQTSLLDTVSVAYFGFSDDGKAFLNGTERVKSRTINLSKFNIDWHSDLTQTVGNVVNTKKSGPGGLQVEMDFSVNIFIANGTLVTELDGVKYFQPQNNT
ncbi:hypothetical protein BU23DRAFT_494309 [Bimuria novae-zelandiae CBS 107.79]|uniref:Saponin hydrolase n=1 Tax=Bimuria novae-zelandiae CBS 107.79 TaxID=1447943 RepID=A0A6A5UH85_9PLEO|nr:hypothetical protein BU23DRAFT_494309 [Bimuria novae-zelandiae CBS 107.79]